MLIIVVFGQKIWGFFGEKCIIIPKKTVVFLLSQWLATSGEISQNSKKIDEMGLVHHGQMVFTRAKF